MRHSPAVEPSFPLTLTLSLGESTCLAWSPRDRMERGVYAASRRNVSTAQTRPQNSKASFAHQHPCGLKSALRRSRGDHAKHVLSPRRGRNVRCEETSSNRGFSTVSGVVRREVPRVE